MMNDRARLIEDFAAKIEAMLDKRHIEVDDERREVLIFLATATELNCRLYWRAREKYQRPSHIADDMKELASLLQQAAEVAENIDPRGILMIYSASKTERPIDDLDPDAIPVCLARLARDVEAAVTVAHDMVRSGSKHREGPPDRGGPTADEPLRLLVRRLGTEFELHLQISPTNTVNTKDGASVSLFDEFVRRAFVHFSPGEEPIPNSAIEKETRRFIATRNDTVLCDVHEVYGLPTPDQR
jgi:hypothetical protein